MKYFDTLIEDQETTISILYKEQVIRIYSSEPSTIHRIIKVLGQPTTKYKKSKTYWSGASWNIDFFEFEKLKEVLYRDTFIDKKLKPIIKEEKKSIKKSSKNKKVENQIKKIQTKKISNKKIPEENTVNIKGATERNKTKKNKSKEQSISNNAKMQIEIQTKKTKDNVTKEIKTKRNTIKSQAENKKVEGSRAKTNTKIKKEVQNKKIKKDEKFEQIQLLF